MKTFMAKLFQQDGTIVGVVDDNTYSITPDSRFYQKMKDAFKANDADTFVELASKELASIEEVVQEISQEVDDIVVKDGQVLLNGQPLTNSIVNAINRFAAEGLDYQPLVKLLSNLLQNPSKRAIDELYQFLEVCGLTITEDGCFLAFKSVRDNYLDKYEGKYDNRPGAFNKMPRNEVDDDCTRTCSKGFHAGALGYAGPGGWYNNPNDKVVICKINPKNVVCIPKDHDFQKLRCCEYEVVADYKGTLKKAVYSGNVDNEEYDYNEDNYYYEEDYVTSPDEMLIGWSYSFDYEKKNGEVGRRYCIVEEKYHDHVICELISPELNAGEIRRFDVQRISNIECIDE